MLFAADLMLLGWGLNSYEMSKYHKRGYKKNAKRNVGTELEGMLFALEMLLDITNDVLDKTRNENLYLTAQNRYLSDLLKEMTARVCRQGDEIERQKEEITLLKRKLSEQQQASQPDKKYKDSIGSDYDKLDFIDNDDVEAIE